MPVVGTPEFDEEKRASWFSHQGEVALPHYYKVYLAEHDVVTEFLYLIHIWRHVIRQQKYLMMISTNTWLLCRMIGTNNCPGEK